MNSRLVRLLLALIFVAIVFSLGVDRAPVLAETGTGSISGTVFFDTDLDGERDSGESPAPGRLLELHVADQGEELVATVESGMNGRYRFDGLDLETNYFVQLVRDAETPCTTEDAAFGVGGQNNTDADLGVVPSDDRTINGVLVSDIDEDGVHDGDEPPLVGWKVAVTGGSGFYCDAPSLTDADGEFRFENLPAGEFSLAIREASPTLAAGRVVWEVTFPTKSFDMPGAYPRMRQTDAGVDLRSVKTARGVELGIHVLSGNGSLTALTFHDLDSDGRHDEGEALFDCCNLIFLRSSEVGVLFLQTERDRIDVGRAKMSGLPPGEYVVAMATWYDNPTGYVDAEGRPVRFITLTEGEAAMAEFGFAPDTPEPTPASLPLEGTPLAPSPPAGPPVSAPNAGSAADSTDSTAILVTALVFIGVVGIAGGALVAGRKTLRRR